MVAKKAEIKESVIEAKTVEELMPEAVEPAPVDTGPKLKEYSQEELLKVFDEILFSGEYTEEIVIKGKLRVIFRSRSAGETVDISAELDKKQYNLLITVQEQRALANLARSIVGYQGRDFSKTPIEEKIKFINRIPISLVATLTDALAEFDRKIDLACREGEQNF